MFAVTLQSVLSLTLAILLNGAEMRTGGCTVVPDDLGRAAASDQGHRVGRPPAQYMVPSYAAVLFAYRQHCRFVQAEATTLPAMNSNREKKKSFPTFFESVTDGNTRIELCVCRSGYARD